MTRKRKYDPQHYEKYGKKYQKSRQEKAKSLGTTMYQLYGGKESYARNAERYRANHKRYRDSNVPYNLYRHAKARSAERFLDFDLTKEYVKSIMPDVCPVFNTKFVVGTMYAASIDRVDNNKGYIIGNVRVISRKANTMKSDCSPDELVMFSRWVSDTYENDLFGPL